MRWTWTAIALVVLLFARATWADTATDTGANTTATGTIGTLTSEFVVTREQGANSRANFQRLYENSTNITPDPSCANVCPADRECWVDSDESAADSWDHCIGATAVESLTTNTSGVIQSDRFKVPLYLTPDGTNGVAVNASGVLAATGTGELFADHLPDGGTTALTCGAGKQGQVQVLDDGTLQYCDGAGTSAMHKLGPVPLAITGSNGLLALEWLAGAAPVAITVFPQATDKPDEGNAAVTGTIAWALAQFSATAPAVTLVAGSYPVATTLSLTGTTGGFLRGAGPTTTRIPWGGNAIDPLFKLDDVRLMEIGGFSLVGTAGTPIYDAFVLVNGTGTAAAPGNRWFHDIVIDGGTTGLLHSGADYIATVTNASCTSLNTPHTCCTGSGAGTCTGNNLCDTAGSPWYCCTGNETGTCGTWSDNNNDLDVWDRVIVTNGMRNSDCTGSGTPQACCHGAVGDSLNTCGSIGWRIEPSQSVAHEFRDSSYHHLRRAVSTADGPGAGGSFHWHGGGGGSIEGVEFMLGSPTREVSIVGLDSESSQKLLDTEGVTSATWNVLIESSRWAASSVINSTTCTVAGAPHECCTGSGTGTCDVIVRQQTGGTLHLIGNTFEGAGSTIPIRFLLNSGSGSTGIAAGNFVKSSLADGSIFAVTHATTERWELTGNTHSTAGVYTAIPDQKTGTTFMDATDPSKRVSLTLSGITTGQTRTDTHPNRDLTLAGTSGTLTSGAVAAFDASGNLVTNAAPTLNGSVTLAGSDGSRSVTATDNTTEPTAPGSGSTLLYPLGGEWYKKDNGDGTNERLMLNNANVTGDITCAAPSSGTSSCSIGTDKVTAAQVEFNWAVSSSEGGPATSAVTLTDGDHGDFSCTSGTCTLDAGVGGGNAFGTITTSSGTSPVADSTSDTLTLSGTAPITVTGNSGTDAIVIAASDATSGAKGVIQLAGDLTGTAASPAIAAGAVDINTDTTGNYVASLNCGSAMTGCPGGAHGSSGTLDVNALQTLAQLGDLCAGNESTRRNTGDSANVCFTAAVGNSAGEAIQVADGGVQLSTVAAPADTVGNYVQSISVPGAPLTCTGCAANQGTTPALTLGGTSAQWDAVNSDGDFMVQGRAETVSGIKNTSTRRNDAVTAVGNVAAGATIPATTGFETFTLTGATTLTGVPTIATSGVAAGTPLTLQNIDATATDCATFQDATVTGTATALSLRGSTRILCPGDGGLRLMFDGTKWVEQAPGTIHLKEGTTEKGLPKELDFDPAFDLTTDATGKTTIALGNSVSLLGASIEKAEAAATFVSTDQLNTWTTGAQTMHGPASLRVETSASANVITCGDAGTDPVRCRLGADPSNVLDAATKQYTDAHIATNLLGEAVLSGGSSSIAGCASSTCLFLWDGGAGSTYGPATAPVTMPCIVRKMTALASSNVPAGDTWTVKLRKNASASGEVTAVISAGAAQSRTTSGNLSFTCGTTGSGQGCDYYTFAVTCAGTCTDATAGRLWVTALCENP